MNDLISIIIPVYNAETTILRCVLSAINQIYPYIEIIVIDDGSTDQTRVILDRLSAGYRQVKVFHQANSGVSCARNKGIEVAKGEWLLFLDADDELDATICELLYEKAKQYEADMAFCNLINIDKESKDYISIFDTKECVYEEEDLKALEKKVISKESDSGKSMVCLSGPDCKLIKSECITRGFPINISLGEDTCFVLYLLHEECCKVVYVNEFLYYRHITQGSLSNGRDDEDVRLAAYTNWVDDYYSDDKEYRSEVNTIKSKNLLRIVTIYLLSENMNFKEKITHINRYRSTTKRSLTFGDLISSKTTRNVKLILFLVKCRMFRMLSILLRLRTRQS